MNTCRICKKTSNNSTIELSEMMFATGEKFQYFQCIHCECLQIIDIPIDLHRHYPANYYSLEQIVEAKQTGFGAWLKKQRMQHCVGESNLIGALTRIIFGRPEMSNWFSISKTGLQSKILDVGCGNGRLLLQLAEYGFKNLTGIDPYLSNDITYSNGVHIQRRELKDITEKYDLVLLNHSFEHFQDPLNALHILHQITNPGGLVLIRIPVIDSEAWDYYREYWVQLDIPRHLHIFSRKTVSYIAEKCGFILESVFEDSHAMQFWASEQYRLGIGLRDPKSYMTNPESSIFSTKDIANYKTKSKHLNKIHKGDQACFFLRRKI